MPVYTVTLPDGTQAEVDAPNEEALQSAVRQLAAQHPKTVRSERDREATEIEQSLAAEDTGPGFFGYVKDVGRGAIGGVIDAAVETGIAVKNFVAYGMEQSARRELERDGVMDKVPGLRETQKQVSAENAEQRALLDETIREEKSTFKQTAGVEAQTGAGKLTEDLVQFLAPYSKLAKIAGASSFAARAAVGATTSSVVVDPYEEGLANLIESQPALANPVTAYLAVDEDDSEAEARLKKGIEDVITGAAADALVGALKYLRALRKAKAEVKPEGAPESASDRILTESAYDDEQAVKVASDRAAEVADDVAEVEARDTFVDIDVDDVHRFERTDIDGGKYKLAVSQSGGPSTIYLSEAGKDGAYIQFREWPRDWGGVEWQMLSSIIEPAWRGRGFGVEMYDRLARSAAERGATLTSDVKVSKDAVRVWESLEKRGYTILRNDSVEIDHAGRFVSTNGEPVFRVQGLSEKPIQTGGSTVRDAVGVGALRNPQAGQLVADVIAQGRGGVFGRTVRELLGGATKVTDDGKIGGYNTGRIDWASVGENVDDARVILKSAEDAVRSLADRAGVARVSMEDTSKVAQELKDTFGVNIVGDTFEQTRELAAKQVATHAVLMDSLKYATDIARKLKSAGPESSDALRRQLVQAVEMYQALHAQARGSTAEVARALANLRQLRRASEAGAQQFADIARELGHDPEAKALVEKLSGTLNAKALHKELAKSPWERGVSAALELFYNSILSSPRTWIVNTLSSLANAVVHIPERATAAALAEIRKGLAEATGKSKWATEGAMWVELKGQIVGMAAGGKIATRAMLAPFRANSFDPKVMGEAYREELAKAWGDTIPVSQVDIAKQRAIRIELPDEPAQTFMDRAFRGMAHGVNGLGSIIRIPSAIIKTTDDLVRVMAHEQERYALAYREAEMLARDPATRDFVRDFAGGAENVADALLNGARNEGSADMFEITAARIADEGAEYAKSIVFQQDGGKFVKWVQSGTAQFPALRLILPFVKTPANLFRWGFLERTPLGILSRDIRKELADPGRVGDIARARLLLGTSVAYGAFELASARDEQGRPKYLTGGRTKGLNSEDFDGIPPYSFRLPGSDKWVSYQRLDPFGMVLGMSADITDIMEQSDSPDSPALVEATRAFIFAMAKNATSKTWLSGLSTFLSAMDDPDRYGDQFLKQLVGGFVPFSSMLRNVTGSYDEYAREAFGLLEKLQAQLPGREALPVKRNWLGEPVKSKNYAGPDVLSPIEVARESDDPLNQELARLRFGYSMPDKKLDGVPLSSAEYSRLLELRGAYVDPATGQTLRQAMTELVARDDYKRLPDDVQIDLLKRMVAGYSRAAAQQFRDEQTQSPSPEGWAAKKQKLDSTLQQDRKKQMDDRGANNLRTFLGLSPAA